MTFIIYILIKWVISLLIFGEYKGKKCQSGTNVLILAGCHKKNCEAVLLKYQKYLEKTFNLFFGQKTKEMFIPPF